jgi:hypothetical protein
MLRFVRTTATLLLLPLAFTMMASGPAATEAPAAQESDAGTLYRAAPAADEVPLLPTRPMGGRATSPGWQMGEREPVRSPSARASEAAMSGGVVYTVNSLANRADSTQNDFCNTGETVTVDGTTVAECTLRAALDEVEPPSSSSAEDSIKIRFDDVPTSTASNGRPIARITPDAELVLENNVKILGNTAPGWQAGESPVVYIDGSNLAAGTGDGLQLEPEADASDVVGLGIVNAPDDGISVDGAGDDDVSFVDVKNCWIGVQPDGTAAPNGWDPDTTPFTFNPPAGIDLRNATFATIGGGAGSRNVIAGNDNGNTGNDRTAGIVVRNSVATQSGSAGDQNEIVGNYIGLAPDGSTPLGNGGYGINLDHGLRDGDDIQDDEETLITDNAVAANARGGLFLYGENVQVLRNTFGTAASGDQTGGQLARGATGIVVQNIRDTLSVDNTIGNPDRSAGDANVIGGYDVGIQVGTSTMEANGTEIVGNYLGVTPGGGDIGLDAAGLLAGAGGSFDITDNVIGNVGAGGSADGGIVLDGSGAFSTIADNVIGLTPTLVESPVDGTGVSLRQASFSTVSDNVIGNASGHGVRLENTSDAEVTANAIGETVGGEDIGNAQYGVYVSGGSENVVVGNAYGDDLSQSTAGNRIGNNGAGGVAVTGSATGPVPIRGNTLVENGLAGGTDPLPIDLGADGQTSNDAANGDADSGPNNLQNWPQITNIDCQSTITGDELTLEYQVPTADANADFGGLGVRADFYVADPGRAGSAVTHIASDTAGSGYETNTIFAARSNLCDKYVVATVTDASGNTSELTGVAQKLPVELAAFDATVQGTDVRLTWTTAAETNNAGFTVEHRPPDAEAWTDVQFVEGRGTVDDPQQYAHTVEGLEPGEHTFRLRQEDLDGTTTLTQPVTATVRLDGSYALTVGPNPLRRQGTVALRVRARQPVVVALYDVLGRRVKTLHDGGLDPGKTQLSLDATGLSSGQYLLRVRGNQFTTTRRITVVR